MKDNKRWIVLILAITAILPLAACNSAIVEADKIEPAMLEPIEGTELNLITLTERAAQRLDIQSEAVKEETMDGNDSLVIPYSAILYGLNGETWIYIRNPGADSLTFVRMPVVVDHIEGDRVILMDGPEIGTEVVTVGVAELYGTDTGVGK